MKKKKITLEYCAYSATIRQMPQNYCVAHQVNADIGCYQYWVCAPDIAADVELCVKVFRALFDFETRYSTPQQLLKTLGFDISGEEVREKKHWLLLNLRDGK